MRGPFINILRSMFANIDTAIYKFIEVITRAIFDVASLNIDLEIVDEIRSRVYILLGVFMMVKLMYSFISYMINPEKMADNNVGGSQIFLKLIMAIAVLMLVPFIFDYMVRVQKAFLPMVPRVILGKDVSTNIADDSADQAKKLSLYILRTFYHPFRDPENNYASIEGAKEIESYEEFQETVEEPAVKGGIFNIGAKGYKYEYFFGLSTIAGAFILFKLISYAIKVVVRLIKLLILEIIAPIPIMSMPMVDVSLGGKEKGDFSFKKWLNEVGKVFIEIFVYMGSIYIILFLLSQLIDNGLFLVSEKIEGLKVDPLRKRVVDVLFVLALFKFLDDVPAYVTSILSPKNKETESHLFGGVYGGLKGAAIGVFGGLATGQTLSSAILGGTSGYIAGKDLGSQGKGVSLGAGFAAGAGAVRQAYTGDKNAKGGLISSLQSMAKAQIARDHLDDLGINSYTLSEAKSVVKSREKDYEDAQSEYSRLIAISSGIIGPDESTVHYKGRSGSDAISTYQSDVEAAERRVRATKEAYNKSKSNLDEAKLAWKSAGLDDTIDDKYNKRTMHKAKKSAQKSFGEIKERMSPSSKSIEERRWERTKESVEKGNFNPWI